MSSEDILINYSELSKADESMISEIITNTLNTDKILHFKDIGKVIKLELDSRKGGTWNVIIGSHYGSFVTHETKT